MNAITKPLAGVERERERERESYNSRKQKSRIVQHSDTHTICSLENKTSIFPYALLKLHARDG